MGFFVGVDIDSGKCILVVIHFNGQAFMHNSEHYIIWSTNLHVACQKHTFKPFYLLLFSAFLRQLVWPEGITGHESRIISWQLGAKLLFFKTASSLFLDLIHCIPFLFLYSTRNTSTSTQFCSVHEKRK